MKLAEIARSMATAALAAVDPERLVREHLLTHRERFTAVLALGKAAPAMARGARDIPGTPAGSGRRLLIRPHSSPGLLIPGWQQLSGGHPLPDRQSLAAGERLLHFLGELTPADSLLVLLSGGSSACVEKPVAGLELEDLIATNRTLLDSGLPIGPVNAVRKHLSAIKGGGALGSTWASRITVLLLSDVPGDDPATVGSGPFVPDPSTFAEAAAAVAALDVPAPVRAVLAAGMRGEVPETVKPDEGTLSRVETRILAGSETAARAAAGVAEKQGLTATVGALAGEATAAARELLDRGRKLDGSEVALILGGETTVALSGERGAGGRNQELALAAAQGLAGSTGELVLTLATDGVDGNTRAAGGVVDGRTWEAARALGLDPREFLRRHDSHRVLAAVAGALLSTGPTGTNVSDLAIYLRSASL